MLKTIYMYKSIRLLSILSWFFIAACSPTQNNIQHYLTAVAENESQQTKQLLEKATKDSLAAPYLINLPYAESQLVDQMMPQPTTLQFELAAQQKISVMVTGLASKSANAATLLQHPVRSVSQLFKRTETGWTAQSIQTNARQKDLAKQQGSAAEGLQEFSFVAEQPGEYALQIVPTIGSQGRLDISIRSEPRFHFPVQTDKKKPVQSFFGAPRDGGRRRHEGVDIFADRGTPVVAAISGRVTRVGESKLGGNTLWMRGEGLSFYYAHLDTVSARTGQKVSPGDVLGTVGNTGNARTTPPHLHFGIYQRGKGAIDPLPLIGQNNLRERNRLPYFAISSEFLEVRSAKANVREKPTAKSAKLATLERHAIISVQAVADKWARVIFANTDSRFEQGFISLKLLQAITLQNAKDDARIGSKLKQRPDSTSEVIGELGPEYQRSEGRYGNFQLVKTRLGIYAWLPILPEGQRTGERDAALNEAS